LYLLAVPLQPRVALLGGAVSLSRDLVHWTGFLVSIALVCVGANALRRYSALQAPLKELEGLSERQRALMGWTGDAHALPASSAAEPIQERAQDSNTLRARQRVKELTTPAPAPSRSTRSPASTAAAAGASSSRSPVPTASLRALGDGFRAPDVSSPF